MSTRTDPDRAYEAFMAMPKEEWSGLLNSLASGGALEPAEQEGFERAFKDRLIRNQEQVGTIEEEL